MYATEFIMPRLQEGNQMVSTARKSAKARAAKILRETCIVTTEIVIHGSYSSYTTGRSSISVTGRSSA
jgi:hypothetical protein